MPYLFATKRRSPQISSQSSQDFFRAKKSKKGSVKKERGRNFEADELETITLELEKRGDRPAVYKTYKRIASIINEKYGTRRTPEQVRTRAKRDKSGAKKAVVEFTKNAKQTGGGKPENEPTALQLRLLNTINPKSYQGVPGGLDTSTPKSTAPTSLEKNVEAKTISPSINMTYSSGGDTQEHGTKKEEYLIPSPPISMKTPRKLKPSAEPDKNMVKTTISKEDVFNQQEKLIKAIEEQNTDLKILSIFLKRNHGEVKTLLVDTHNTLLEIASSLKEAIATLK